MIPRFTIRSILLLALVPAGAALAQSSPRYTFSGFGTLGYAALGDDDFTYHSSRAEDGADEQGSFALDSRLGLQLDIEATDALTGTLQAVAREGAEGDPTVELEWGFARWFVSDSVTVRAGRMAFPAFAVSDYRGVGYANTTVRPPEDVYAQVPFSRYDGVDLSVNGELGETLWGFQVGAGVTEETLPEDVHIDGDDAYVVNLTAERGPARLRLSRASARIAVESPDLDSLSDALRQAAAFIPELGAIADDLSPESTRGHFDALGLRLDFERVFVDAEHTWRRIDTRAGQGDARSWAIVLGTRLGAFTPYALASAFEDETDPVDIELPPVPQLAPLAGAIDAVYENRSQATLGLGLRWDVAPKLALKAQVEQVSSESRGISIDRDDGDPTALTKVDDVTLYAVSLDFVF